MSWTFLGFEQITSTGTSTYALTLPTSAGMVQRAVVSCEGGKWHFRADGSVNAPTTAVGELIEAGETVELFDNALAKYRFIAESTDCNLNVHYYG